MSTPEIKDEGFQNFMNGVYDVMSTSDEDILGWYEAYAYKAFNRIAVLKSLMRKVPDPKVVQQIVMICGLLGPKRAAEVKLLNGKTISSYGIPASGAKGSEGVSCQRITAATADLCAYFLKKSSVPKRLNHPCPGWLQFPAAGSITLPDDLREQHIDFSRKFTVLIGGSFNEQIYSQMMMNSYLDKKLSLFDTSTILVTSSSSSASSSVPTKPTKPKV